MGNKEEVGKFRIVIIAEKPIASERIAFHLAHYFNTEVQRRVFQYKDSEVDFFVLNDVAIVPLEGHLVQPTAVRRGKYPKFDWVLQEPRKGRRKARWELVKQLVKNSEKIIGATDNDEEGEVMLYYTCQALGLEPETLPRMRFVELTYEGIVRAYERAINGDETLHMGMAMAGHYRHLQDLWFGKNISHLFSEGAVKHGAPSQIKFWLGRVKIPLLTKLASERRPLMKRPEEEAYEEIVKHSEKEIEYEVVVHTDYYGLSEVQRIKVTPEEIPEYFRSEWKGEVVEALEEEFMYEPTRRVFNTTGITEEASRYGVPATRVMDILQFLYQIGCISYPRTPSTKLPRELDTQSIINRLAEHFDWIDKEDFIPLSELPELQTSPDEPHSGIYPIDVPPETLPDDYLLIWELIARKFLMALGKPYEKKRLNVTINIYRDGEFFREHKVFFEEITYWGWRKYEYDRNPYTDVIPDVEVGDDVKIVLSVNTLNVYGGTTKGKTLNARISKLMKTPVSGWNGLLSWMEYNRLGTEATRAEHIKEITSRGYAVGEEELTLTAIGQRIAELCKEDIPLTLRDTEEMYEAMSRLEKTPDIVDELLEEAKRKIIEIYEAVDVYKLGEKLNDVGNCPVCGEKARLVFFNNEYFVGCSRYPECKYLLPISK